MKNKYLDLFYSSVWLLFATANCVPSSASMRSISTGIFDTSPIGQCHVSLSRYLTENFGVNYASDENLVVTPFVWPEKSKRLRNFDFQWFVDQTPSRNPTRLLFRIEDHGRACIVLFAPAADTIAQQEDDQGFPKSFITHDAPSQSGQQTTIIYLINKKSQYVPTRCTRTPRKGKPRIFKCSEYRFN
jgi:hypothetical protein